MAPSSDYQLHGLRLRVGSDQAAVQERLRRILRYKGAEPVARNADADLRLAFDVQETLDALPATARHVGTSKQCAIEVWTVPEQMLLRHDDATVAVHPEAGRAGGHVRPTLLEDRNQQGRDPLFHLVVLGLGLLLRGRGRFPLHAAALTRDGAGLLCPGRSGRGKTTITLSLLRHGWTALSDDTVLLRSIDDRVEACTFRRPLCVDPGTADHFPELGGSDWPPALSDASKWRVDIDRLYSGQSGSTCTPRLLVLPTIVDAPTSRVEPIGPKPALDQLLAQSAFFLSSCPETADRHLAVLRQLVGQARTYRLHAGRNVLDKPRTVHTLLAPLLSDDPASGATFE